jgi:hypothetical protein
VAAHSVRYGSVATLLLGLRVRIPLGPGRLSVVGVVCFQMSYVHWADHSFGGVPSVVCLISVIVKS